MKNSARHRARAFVLQGLYQWMLSGTDPSAIRSNLREASGFAKCDRAFLVRSAGRLAERHVKISIVIEIRGQIAG